MHPVFTHDIDLAIELADEMIVMTAQKTFQDKPSALVAQGIFDHLFGDEHVAFDTKKGNLYLKTFKLINPWCHLC
jgi:iron complex transport system ATP-binding protein